MCGRFNITTDPAALLDAFAILDALNRLPVFTPRYNIAPSEPPLPVDSVRKAGRRMTAVPIINRDGNELVAQEAVWPLIPVWAGGEVPKYSTANARAETMAEKNSYRNAWKKGQRCLIPATGFYEWQDAGEKTRQPWHIHPLNSKFFLFGGLWESSNDVVSCTIITMPANTLMREIHNAGKNKHRMPLILSEDQRQSWLTGSTDKASALVQQYPAEEMGSQKVGRALNNPNYDDASLLDVE